MSVASLARQKRMSAARTAKVNRYRKKQRSALSLFRRAGSIAGFLVRSSLIFLFVIATSLGLLAGYRYVTSHPYFNLKTVQVSGNSQLDHGQILQWANISLGQNALELNMGDLHRSLLKNPWVREASITRTLPDTITITVQEHRPVFWVQKKGQMYYAKANGSLIAPVTPDKFISLPLLKSEVAPAEQRQILQRLLAGMEAKDLPFSLSDLAWVKISQKGRVAMYLQNLEILVELENNDLDANMQRLDAAWKDMADRRALKKGQSLTAFNGKVLIREK